MTTTASRSLNDVIPGFFGNPVIRPYLENVRNWQGYIRFLGLPDRRDHPDVIIDRLFVEPLLTSRYVSPDENPGNWTDQAETLLDAIVADSPLVLLGDPGIGKSTFLNYVAWLLSHPVTSPLIERLGWHLPIPMVLRELPVRGITDFDGLLNAFLDHDMSAPLREDDGLYLKQTLADGQAFLLLDGIDELGDRETRESLRSAVFDGIARYPDCRWLLTSRIVGYDEVPLDTVRSRSDEDLFSEEPTGESRAGDSKRAFREFHRMKRESVGGEVPVRYIAPFDDRRIAAFARNWYVQREAAATRAGANANHLVRAVHANESILRLARVPNLLTMMALIHRIEATLPHGRALLYERIAEAYLESIDKFRGVESSPHNLPRKKSWLARVGFEMQRRRTVDDEADETNILMDAATVREWLSEEMGRSDAVPDIPSPEDFLKFTGRRSGLFLPRGEGRYAFVHLSFQEYFAAFALKREVTRFQWAKGKFSRLGFDRATLGDWAGQSLWRETFVFLFELLASEEDDDWHADLLDCVFGEGFSKLMGSKSKEASLNLGHLLARLIVNSRSGLTFPKRMEAIESCVKVEFEHPPDVWGNASGTFSVLLGEDAKLNVKIFKQIGIQIEKVEPGKRHFDLRGVQVSDLGPVANLTTLESLHLNGTSVSDLDLLANLTALEHLYLSGTGVSDLGPLVNHTALRTLDLDRTGVSDLGSVAKLTALERLCLAGTDVLDLGPLANLTALEWLLLNGTQVLDLGPLANLTALEWLDLDDTSISDLRPLVNLAALEWLDLSETGVSDLGPLANLTALERLNLSGTGVSDLGPVANLTALKHLYLSRTGVSDLGPLANLPALESLYLNGTGVSDLGPLSSLPALETLYLNRAGVLDLGPLSNLAALERLHLDGTGVSDLGPLANLTALRWLDLDGTRVSDLGPLSSLPALESLYLNGAQVSGDAVEELRTYRPELNIIFGG